MHFIALRRGCSESKLAFLGFGTALLLYYAPIFLGTPLRFHKQRMIIPAVEIYYLVPKNSLVRQYPAWAPYIALSRCGAHRPSVLNFGDLG